MVHDKSGTMVLVLHLKERHIKRILLLSYRIILIPQVLFNWVRKHFKNMRFFLF